MSTAAWSLRIAELEAEVERLRARPDLTALLADARAEVERLHRRLDEALVVAALVVTGDLATALERAKELLTTSPSPR